MNARELIDLQLKAGKTKKEIAETIGYSRPAVSLYIAGKYQASVAEIEAAIVKAYDQRTCPHDGEEKTPAYCRRVALRARPFGFPDAETLWLACQSCPHKPLSSSPKEGGK